MPTWMRLMCGAAAGPLFIVLVLVQDYTRVGFDQRLHPLSLHALGDGWGWLQTANFVVTGALNVAFATGLRKPAGTVAAVATGLFGLGLVIAGLFPADPAFGFPSGTTTPPSASTVDLVHGAGSMVAIGALIVACFALGARFARCRAPGWAMYSLVTGAVVAWCFGLALSDEERLGLYFRAVVLLGWTWSAAVALSLSRRSAVVTSR